jgi:glycine/D-amino acid oxidase-like deaminating enzyme
VKLPESLWTASATTPAVTPVLTGKHAADVVVVGGGFTGLSTALHLAEAGKSVIVLEAGEPGWGASGRNGGQVNPGWRMLPSEITAKYGANRGATVLDMLNRACDVAFEVIARHGIDCDAERPGFVHAGFGQTGKAFLEGWIREWGELGVKVERHDRASLKKLIGTELYPFAMRDPRGGHLQPLSYARGLAKAAAGKGAAVHGNSRVDAIHRQGSDWRVVTGNGEVVAEHVVLCTNAYSDRLWPDLRKTVIPVTTFVAATEPLDAERLKSILPGRHAVAETRRALHYFKLDRDNRFVIGGRGNFTNLNEPGSTEHLQRTAREIFPALEGVSWEYGWGGRVAVTPDHTPRLFKLAENVHAGLGFNGRGVAMCTMFGTQLTRAVLGEETDMPIEPIDIVPNHAFRQLGITWHLATGRLLDRRDVRDTSATLAG